MSDDWGWVDYAIKVIVAVCAVLLLLMIFDGFNCQVSIDSRPSTEAATRGGKEG